MKFLTASLILLVLCSSAPALAATGSATGTIQHVFTYGDGSMLFTGFDFPGASCGNNGGFYIPGDHPQMSRLLSVLLTARATGATVHVVATIDNCWYPYLTSGPDTYVDIQP